MAFCHESLYFFHSTWDARQQLHSAGCHRNVIFNPDPTKSSETLQDIIVDEAGLRGVTEGLVQEVIDEVNPWLDGQHHALLQVPGSTQASEPWQVNAFHSLWVASNVMHVDSK